MTRRSILAALPAADVSRFVPANRPRCPLCHTEISADHPEYMPMVATVDDGKAAEDIALPGVRLCVCSSCGVFFAARP